MNTLFKISKSLFVDASDETLQHIAETKSPKKFHIQYNSTKLFSRFKNLALGNGADIKQIEAVLREADRSPSELLRLINLYTEEEQ